MNKTVLFLVRRNIDFTYTKVTKWKKPCYVSGFRLFHWHYCQCWCQPSKVFSIVFFWIRIKQYCLYRVQRILRRRLQFLSRYLTIFFLLAFFTNLTYQIEFRMPTWSHHSCWKQQLLSKKLQTFNSWFLQKMWRWRRKIYFWQMIFKPKTFYSK